MALTNLDRPLGDIIKEGARRGGGRGGGRGRGGSRGGSRGGGSRGGGFVRGGRGGSFRGRGGSSRGGALRPSFRGGAGSFRGARGAANGAGPIRRERGGFRQQQATPYQRPPPRQQVGGGLAAGSRIMLTNLDPQLTEDDCLEIFQNVGPVSRAIIHYNRDGSSQGTAEVHFANKNDALRAVDEYDAAQIDGRPMYVKVIANKAPTVVQRAPAPAVQTLQFPAFRGKPNGVSRGARGGAPRGGARGGTRGGSLRRGGAAPRGARGSARGQSRGGARGGRGGRGRENKPTPTAAALDAEMDQYYSHGAPTETDLIAAGQPANPAVAPKQ